MSPVILNRRARREYEIIDTYEAGIILSGPEVKSLRLGRANIGDAYADPREGELWLINCHISEYTNALKEFHYSPTRPRKLLLHKKELVKMINAVNREGATIIPLSLYFNKRGMLKVDLGIAKGKRQYDKRQTEKNRDWKRDQDRIIRDKNI